MTATTNATHLRPIPPEVLAARTVAGSTLGELSEERPLLLVLLRHNGCVFCREAVSDLHDCRAALEAEGVGIALVHMDSDDAAAAALYHQYEMDDAPRVADPDHKLYTALGLTRGSAGQLFGWSVIKRGYQACFYGRHGVGIPGNHVRQMPGVFLLHQGQIVGEFIHKTAGDRPEYLRLVREWQSD